MLSSTSVSSIGNLHRRMLFLYFFPFCSSEFRFSVVQRMETRWRRRDLDGGWIFLYKWTQCRGAKDSSQTVWDWLSLNRSYVWWCGWMPDTDPSTWTGCLGRRAQKAEAKKREIKWLIFLVLADERREGSIFPRALDSLRPTQKFCQVRVWRYLRVLNWPKPQTQIFAQVHPSVWFGTLKSLSSHWNASRSFFFFFRCCCCCWKALKRSTLCSFGVPVPAESAMCKRLEWQRNF